MYKTSCIQSPQSRWGGKHVRGPCFELCYEQNDWGAVIIAHQRDPRLRLVHQGRVLEEGNPKLTMGAE